MTCMPVRSRLRRFGDVFFCRPKCLRHLANQKLPRSHGTVPKNTEKMSQVANTAWNIELEEKLLDIWQERPCFFDATSKQYSNRDQGWTLQASVQF